MSTTPPPPPSRDQRKTYCDRTFTLRRLTELTRENSTTHGPYLLPRSKHFHHIGPNRSNESALRIGARSPHSPTQSPHVSANMTNRRERRRNRHKCTHSVHIASTFHVKYMPFIRTYGVRFQTGCVVGSSREHATCSLRATLPTHTTTREKGRSAGADRIGRYCVHLCILMGYERSNRAGTKPRRCIQFRVVTIRAVRAS